MTISQLKGVNFGRETWPHPKQLLPNSFNALPNMWGGVIVGCNFTARAKEFGICELFDLFGEKWCLGDPYVVLLHIKINKIRSHIFKIA